MIKPNVKDKAVQLIGLASIGLGMLTICGYLINKPEYYTWSMEIPMALNTAVGFVGVGIAVFLCGRRLATLNNN